MRESVTNEARRTKGHSMLLLINPETGSAISCRKGEGELAVARILAGFKPVGPRGQKAAAAILANA